MITYILCDDDKNFIANLKNRISAVDTNSEVKAYTKPLELLKDTANNPNRVYIVDIDMPYISGFEVASKLLDKYPWSMIVFISNNESFVFDSFKFKAARFIRKNDLENDLSEAMNFIKKHFEHRYSSDVKSINGNQAIVDFSTVRYIEVFGNEIVIHDDCQGILKSHSSLTGKYQADTTQIHLLNA